jgi:hypothetical protein
VVSQFGVMFFADPVAAFTNIKSAIRAGGRIAFVCLQSRERSRCFSIPLSAVARYIGLPPLKPPRSPGQFGLADPAFIREILDSAGFVNIEL